jgi:hypothetical protein
MSYKPTVRMNFQLVEASVHFPDDFWRLDSLVRADLLRDMLADVQAAYDRSLRDLNDGMKRDKVPV